MGFNVVPATPDGWCYLHSICIRSAVPGVSQALRQAGRNKQSLIKVLIEVLQAVACGVLHLPGLTPDDADALVDKLSGEEGWPREVRNASFG